MRTFGIILIIVGIIMFLITGFSYTTEETVIDIGSIEVSKEDEKQVNWPPYAGGAALIAGIALVALSQRKS